MSGTDKRQIRVVGPDSAEMIDVYVDNVLAYPGLSLDEMVDLRDALRRAIRKTREMQVRRWPR